VLSVRDNGDVVLLDESPVYVTDTDSRGELYRKLLDTHGRCISRVYIDRPDGPPSAVGWVFQARRPFEDDPAQVSLIETWVTVHSGPPTITRNYAPSRIIE
jgi:hypothetical protein